MEATLDMALHCGGVATWICPSPIQLPCLSSPHNAAGPRIGYFPLLVSTIQAHFSSSLPLGVDTVWFEYKGLPLKWCIPSGVLFDLLCADTERPWNLTSETWLTTMRPAVRARHSGSYPRRWRKNFTAMRTPRKTPIPTR
ncbi:autophagy protein 5-like isoform X2 [Hordeum vulgare subsp. vulgare]|uniref:autophagy protein 5-like isoform X2 n=1 Tax=Hordeum vulgare subsp. vulgare TaxID=112509 RepID=UPI000B465B1D|nr:autophagy protein 5-like isoform X2 [Hordeum vulgare subsp. vulgare]